MPEMLIQCKSCTPNILVLAIKKWYTRSGVEWSNTSCLKNPVVDRNDKANK